MGGFWSVNLWEVTEFIFNASVPSLFRSKFQHFQCPYISKPSFGLKIEKLMKFKKFRR